MNERMIEVKKRELMDEILGVGCAIHSRSVFNSAWKAATQASVDIALEILRKVLRDETSELTYGAASQIQNRLHQELDA